MSGTVQYRRLDDSAFFDDLEAPATITYRPGRIIARVDARECQRGTALIAELSSLSDDLISPYRQQKSRLQQPSLGCQIHRVRRVAGGRLLAAEIDGDIAHVEIRATLMSDDLAAALGSLGTSVGHYLSPH